MNHRSTVFWTQAAMIAALYVALTLAFAPLSFGQVQMRVSEALTILPVFTPAAIPGLFIGCLIANLTGGAMLVDVIAGSLATLAAAWCTYRLRRLHPLAFPLPPILANAVVVPFVLRYAYGVPLPIPFMMLTVGAGEAAAAGVLGLVLYAALRKFAPVIFHGTALN